MKQLQSEHAAWIARKYPGQTPKVPAVGCLEEAGELVHAISKIEQVQTWGEDGRHKLSQLRRKLSDAVGDCGIYACSLCNANEWDFAEMWECALDTANGDGVAIDAAIILMQCATEVALEPEESQKLYNYLSQLLCVANCLGLDAEACVCATWLEVRCR